MVRGPTTSRRRSSSEATSLLRRAAYSGVSGSSTSQAKSWEREGSGRRAASSYWPRVYNVQRKSENVGRKEGPILVAIGDDAHGYAGVLS